MTLDGVYYTGLYVVVSILLFEENSSVKGFQQVTEIVVKPPHV